MAEVSLYKRLFYSAKFIALALSIFLISGLFLTKSILFPAKMI
jgi:hypothetical protein